MPPDPDTSYKHAPLKDGDPWTVLLTPELEADTIRCNAWKDEVQNLLIFAGLFSAVVTAFVIESYKFLLPDPNDAVVGLLFHIANGLNNTSPFPPSVSTEAILTPFSKTPSAIRINAFWFISLILSLTTVLIGTIALQWLREHQSYGGYSSKEKLAILHMRTKAIEAWYLPQVFAVLPLLLQAALVLFLAGLIDFSLPLGPKLTIPVSIIVGWTLFFLAATTVFPSLQGLLFLCGLFPRKTVPTPCPFKSPQSHAFRALCGIMLRTISRTFPPSGLGLYNRNSRWRIKTLAMFVPDHLAPFAFNMWYQRTWGAFDREWLSLRDACHQRILDNDPDLFYHIVRWSDLTDDSPLSDITQYLVMAIDQKPGAKHTESFLAALVHCFQELSESIWIQPPHTSIQDMDRHNHYFEQLLWNPSRFCSLSKYLLHGGAYDFDRFNGKYIDGLDNYVNPKQQLFSNDQVVNFLGMLLNKHPSPVLFQYQLELWLSVLSRILHSRDPITPFTPADIHNFSPSVIDMITDITSSIKDKFTPDQELSILTNLLTSIFELAASPHVSQDQLMNSLCTHPAMSNTLDTLGLRVSNYLRRPYMLQDIDAKFAQIFEKVKFGEARDSLLEALHETFFSSQTHANDLIEARFFDDINPKFNGTWWLLFFNYSPAYSRVKQGPSSNDKGSINSCPDSPNMRPQGSSDSQLAEAYLNSQPKISRHEFPSNLDDDADEYYDPYLPSNLPAVLNHLEVTREGPDVVNDFPLSNSRPLFDGPSETRLLGHDHTTTVMAQWLPPPDTAVPSSIVPQQAMVNQVIHSNVHHHLQPDESDLAGDTGSPSVETQEALANAAILSDRNDPPLNELHLIIDVEPPPIVERAGANKSDSAEDHPADDARPDDAIIRVEPPL